MQSRYLLDPSVASQSASSPYDYKWDIPVTYTTSGDPTSKSQKWLSRQCAETRKSSKPEPENPGDPNPTRPEPEFQGFGSGTGFPRPQKIAKKNQNQNFINLFFSTDPFLLVNAQSGTDWIKFNVGQYGFYRVNYPESEWAQFAQLLMKSHEVNRFFRGN